jgi:hypothetical protein
VWFFEENVMQCRGALQCSIRNKQTSFAAALSLLCATLLLSACRFKSSVVETTAEGALDPIPFPKAGGEIVSSLTTVHASALQSAPAAVRPDPDLYARRLLKQFRKDGNTLARQLGRIEKYRLMLGGASEDFRTVPQDAYDATSLLTLQKVAQEVCISLITPSAYDHPGWSNILPESPANVQANVKFLMGRMLGFPESALNSTAVSELVEMVNAFPENGVVTAKSYLPACSAIAMDAEALLL